MSASTPSCKRTGTAGELSNAQTERLEMEKAHIPNFTVSNMLSLFPTIQKDGHPTRVEKDGRGLPVFHHASPLPGHNCLIERCVVAVCRIDSYIRGTGLRRDEIGIAEAALDDLDAQVAHGLDVQWVPHQRRDLEIGVGLDEVGKHRT